MVDLKAYFGRIGYTGSGEPSLATLRELHSRHPLAIPFENLDAVAERPIALDLVSLQRKLVENARGGYCFEQNLLFAHVLEALGFQVTRLAARVVWERPPEEIRARTHMLLAVDLGEGTYLADVGFGGLTPTAPLRLEPEVVQTTTHEPCRVLKIGSEFAVEGCVRNTWKRLYRFDLQPQHQVDIELLNFYVARHAGSPMRGRLVAARVTPEGRYALQNGRLVFHGLDGRTSLREAHTLAELRSVLADVFGVATPVGDDFDNALVPLLG